MEWIRAAAELIGALVIGGVVIFLGAAVGKAIVESLLEWWADRQWSEKEHLVRAYLDQVERDSADVRSRGIARELRKILDHPDEFTVADFQEDLF